MVSNEIFFNSKKVVFHFQSFFERVTVLNYFFDQLYDLLKLHKQLGLGMSEGALVYHIFVRHEPQVQDYVKVRYPQNMVQLLELSKFEERYSCKTRRGSRNSDNVKRRGWNERRISNADYSRRNWKNSEVFRRPSNGRNYYRGNYENGRQENQWFDSRNRFQKDDQRFNDSGYQFRNGVKMTILVDGTREIEVRVRILVEAIGGNGVD
ncbi:uncharacterized protein TNCV_2560381 [Trichonephila clavipes]|uniref:Uncharacterized protein n=1 Tax=Trichonephila clavipes TaxID=2585209 RepID=A0A8X6R0M5_TRICX|nr:uncharacterized protein TNCV_2560381 [Trichonephila clavipes]